MDLRGYFADRPVDKKGINTRTVKGVGLIQGAMESNSP